MTLKISETPGAIQLNVKIVPGASRTRIVGLLGEVLKIAVSKPPSGGEANRAVCELLAETFGVAKSSVEIVSGHSNPRKNVQIRGISSARASEVLLQIVRAG